MGTNYYVKLNVCPTCKREEKEIHLGKCSGGWKFLFARNDEYYKDVPSLKKWLKDKQIWNEYGDTVTNDLFWQMVKEQQKFPLKHYRGDDWETMIGGYRFTKEEIYFS